MKKKIFLTLFIVGMVLMIALPLALLTHVPCQAEAIRYPVPAYEGEALEKVRAWEKEWVGKRITPANIAQVKEFMPESLYNLMSDPEKWGETWFEIVPYREIPPTKGEVKFTRKYAGTCSIDSERRIVNYVSGIPFPQPKTALEMMYNFDLKNLGDNLYAYQNPWLVDGRRKYDKYLVLIGNGIWYTGRREVPPVPEITPNNKKIYRAMHGVWVEPAMMNGSRNLSIKWSDSSRPYGAWNWSSATRRITRMSTAQRQDASGGSDMCFDDNMVYDHSVPIQKYKLLGKKDLLIARHQDNDQLFKNHKEGYCILDGGQREMINTFVVEAVHTDPNYLYSKQIYYICPESWYILYADKYDRKGRLWKLFDVLGSIQKNLYNGENLYVATCQAIIDVQRMHSTAGPVNPILGQIDEFHETEYYVPSALQKYGY